jgi:hypothetical protein
MDKQDRKKTFSRAWHAVKKTVRQLNAELHIGQQSIPGQKTLPQTRQRGQNHSNVIRKKM